MKLLFSQVPSTETPSEKETYLICALTSDSHRNMVIGRAEEQESNSNINTGISSLESDEQPSLADLDDSPTYSPGCIENHVTTGEQTASMKNNSQRVDANLQNNKNNNITSTSHSLFKNPAAWWQNQNPQQKESLIKTGIFIAGCGVAAFFPEYSIAEKLLVLVCLPCAIEFGETVITATSAFS